MILIMIIWNVVLHMKSDMVVIILEDESKIPVIQKAPLVLRIQVFYCVRVER